MACKHALELPSVHFLCQCSYHEHCFQSFSDADENECPACQPENRKIMDIVRSQDKTRDHHDEFQHRLERAEDSFSVVAQYFGMGLFRDNNGHAVQKPEKTGRREEIPARIDPPQPSRPRAPPAGANPFREEGTNAKKSTNPFGSSESTPSPREEDRKVTATAGNPFGEEDYDESLNPFGE